MQTNIMRAQSKAATSDQLLQHSSSQRTPVYMHDRSRVFGTLISLVSIEEDSMIANFRMETRGKRQTMITDTSVLLSTDYLLQLEPLKGQRIGLTSFDGRIHVRPLETIPGEEPQATPRPHKAPVMAAVEEIRSNLPNKSIEAAYGEDLPAILAVLQESPSPLKTAEIAMRCHLTSPAALNRINILRDSGEIAHEKIHRIVGGKDYVFATKRWQLAKQDRRG